MPALVAWRRSMLTMTPPGRSFGEAFRACKDGRSQRKGVKSKAYLGTLLGHRCCIVSSVRETTTTPGLKSPVLFAAPRNVYLDMCRAPAGDAVSKLHPGLRVVGHQLPGKLFY